MMDRQHDMQQFIIIAQFVGLTGYAVRNTQILYTFALLIIDFYSSSLSS